MARTQMGMGRSLEQALASGQLVTTVEITPPLGGDPSRALAAAESQVTKVGQSVGEREGG